MNLFHVDAFTDILFKGNPAGVCILRDHDIPDEQKRLIAAELKHSETAFVLIRDGDISIRWFTPTIEMNLCGHATLAAAHILFEEKIIPYDQTIRFNSRSGELTAKRRGNMIELDFPRAKWHDCEQVSELNSAFGIEPLYTGKGDDMYIIEIADAAQLRKLDPDFEKLKSVLPGEFILTARSDVPEYDFISRFFGPAVGIPEDPVTGSAHCYLAPYWTGKLKKASMTGFQASPRTGVVECELTEEGRVALRGSAITFFTAEIDASRK